MDIVVDLAEIPDGGAKIVEVRQGFCVALFRVDDRVAAINNRCPHASASLGHGDFDGTIVICPVHDYRFNVWTGKGYGNVKTYPTEVIDQRVRITVPE